MRKKFAGERTQNIYNLGYDQAVQDMLKDSDRLKYLSDEMGYAYACGHRRAMQDFLEKACEWLESRLPHCIENFKKTTCKMKCKDCKEFAYIKRSENSDCFFEKMCDYAEIEEEKVYWQSFRTEAARNILSNALIPYAIKEFSEESINIDYWTGRAVEWADALVKKLKEKEEK